MPPGRTALALALLLALIAAGGSAPPGDPAAPGPWATYRGNPQRTGCADTTPGPAAPKVLWVHKGGDHFVASPVPAGSRLFLPGLGAYNVPVFLALDADPKAANRVAWKKTTPALKLPTVGSPA